MGFFKKIGKGIGKAFKKIGKGIKSAFKSFGKFMNKFGVLGQVAMFFIMPHIAGALMKGMGAMWSGIAGQTATQGLQAANAASVSATAAATAGGANVAAATAAGKAAAAAVNTTASGLAGATGSGALASASRAVGSLMRGAGNFVSKGINVFRNVTEGATNFIKEFSQTAANKLSSTLGFDKIPFENAAENFFGAGDSAWKATTDEAGFRMNNLLADKSTTNAFDVAARDSRIAISAPTTTVSTPKIKAGDVSGQFETVKSEYDPKTLTTDISNQYGAGGVQGDVNASFDPKTLTTDISNQYGAGGVQGDVNASFDPKTVDSKSLVSKTRDYLKESLLAGRDKAISEVTNFVPNTIERTAETITGIPSQALNTKVQQLLAPDAPQQFAAMGPAEYIVPDISSGPDVTGMMPQADYGVRMGTMPYGNTALQVAQQRFAQFSSTG